MEIPLPRWFRYINAHLSGRPLFTYLWLIWVLGCYGFALASMATENDRFAARAGINAIFAGAAVLYFAFRLALFLQDSDTRRWLVTVYNPEDFKVARTDVRIAIYIAAVLATAVLIEYLFYR